MTHLLREKLGIRDVKKTAAAFGDPWSIKVELTMVAIRTSGKRIM